MSQAQERPIVPPPRGVLDYCTRNTTACTAPKAEDSASSVQMQQSPGLGGAGARSDNERRSDWFRAMLNHHAAAIASPEGGAVPTMAPFTEQAWVELQEVHRLINYQIIEATDQQIYGVSEYWATPRNIRTAGSNEPIYGDCEDYALEKRLELLARGWPAGSLSIATAHAPFRGLHVVLVVRTDRGDYVLDDTRPGPEPIEDVQYEWLSYQIGHDLLTWFTFDEQLPDD